MEGRAIFIRAGDVDDNTFGLQCQFSHCCTQHSFACARWPDQQQLTERCEIQLPVDIHAVEKKAFHTITETALDLIGQDHVSQVDSRLKKGIRPADDEYILAAFQIADCIIALSLESCPGFQAILWQD